MKPCCNTQNGHAYRSGYDVLPVFLGLLLLLAAALKAYQLMTEPALDDGLLTTRWVLIGVVQFELLLGLWLVSGVYRRLGYWMVFGCFLAFLVVTGYKVVIGEASCGCLGRVPVPPKYTLVFDLAVLVALVLCRPAASVSLASGRTRRHAGLALAGFLILGVPSGILMARFSPATLGADGSPVGDGTWVVLEPQTWQGQRFSLRSQIDNGWRQRLATGPWPVDGRTLPFRLPELRRDPAYLQGDGHRSGGPIGRLPVGPGRDSALCPARGTPGSLQPLLLGGETEPFPGLVCHGSDGRSR